MAPRYANGSIAWFICDRCGLRGKYADSKVEPITGYRVHPRHFFVTPRPKPIYPDAIGIYNPRPDVPFSDPDPPVDLIQYVGD